MELFSKNREQTQLLGQLLGQQAFPSMIIALKGEVGAGKTEFSKGFTVGANSEIATSPTFAIMNVYEGGKLPIYHFDFYRCGGDMEEFEEYIFGDGVAIIEWSEYLDLPPEVLTIEIEKISEDERKLTFTSGNEEYEQVIRRAYGEYTRD